MRTIRLRRPSPALVLSLVALVVALGGTSYAAFSLPKNSVGTKQLKKGAVTTSKIKNGTVTKSKINTSGLTVPNALHANSADSATVAGSAAPSGAAGGGLTGTYPNPTLAAPEAVHVVGASGQPAFQNGWTNFGGGFAGAGFWKDAFGVVHLQGTVHSGTNLTAIFTLPAGYRPTADLFGAAAGDPSAVDLEVLSTGDVVVDSGTGPNIGLDGFTFRAG